MTDSAAQVVMYGGSPYWEPSNPWVPGFRQKQPDYTPVQTLTVCDACGRHARLGEPCVWCLKARLEDVEERLDVLLRKAVEPLVEAVLAKPKRKKAKA